ncbi:MAG: class I SAM-dependent methyltransferase [Treponema sp.]|jgi:23S rRNA G2069 N7-methylase RlmK/C1962 C5-methylase RlmI|nr:class I SAM-dependent methyltransferase [Treponema sp.]
MKDKTEFQALMLKNRLQKRQRHLAKWARCRGIGAYRLYDRDIPEIPLVIDYYRGRSETEERRSAEAAPVEAVEALAGALYRRPYERDPAEEEAWLAAMEGAMTAALGIPGARIFLKERRRLRGRREQYGKSEAPRGGFVLAVDEGGLRFRVNLSDYLDTGLFPDRREIRARIREEAAGKRVLNLFAYTCAFSVYAAAGGAASVDSVDLSNTYLDWGRRNFALNGLRGGGAERGPFRFIRADALRFLEEAAGKGRTWDLIIMDPPAFSNSKKMAGTLDIRRDHPALIAGCLKLLSPEGRLWFSAGASRFRLRGEAIEDLLRRQGGPGGRGSRRLRIEGPGDNIVDEDFRGRRPPPCCVLSLSAGAGPQTPAAHKGESSYTGIHG